MPVTIGMWDAILIVCVALQAAAMSYVSSRRLKALIFSTPVPFTLVCLAVGRPLDASNVAGFVILVLYGLAIKLLYERLGLPMLLTLALSVGFYICCGAALARIDWLGDAKFWIVSGVAATFAAIVLRLLGPRQEPDHRSPMPIYLKVPFTIAVVTGLVLMKSLLLGFSSSFPLVAVVGTYEARRCPSVVYRSLPLVVLAAIPLVAICRYTQATVGLGGGLALGWIGYLAIMLPLNRGAFLPPPITTVPEIDTTHA